MALPGNLRYLLRWVYTFASQTVREQFCSQIGIGFLSLANRFMSVFVRNAKGVPSSVVTCSYGFRATREHLDCVSFFLSRFTICSFLPRISPHVRCEKYFIEWFTRGLCTIRFANVYLYGAYTFASRTVRGPFIELIFYNEHLAIHGKETNIPGTPRKKEVQLRCSRAEQNPQEHVLTELRTPFPVFNQPWRTPFVFVSKTNRKRLVKFQILYTRILLRPLFIIKKN